MAKKHEFQRETAGMLHTEKARRKSKPPGVARKKAKRTAPRRRGKRG